MRIEIREAAGKRVSERWLCRARQGGARRRIEALEEPAAELSDLSEERKPSELRPA